VVFPTGFKLCQDGSSIKAFNSPARLISGGSPKMSRIGTWAGKATFVAIPMDDFQPWNGILTNVLAPLLFIDWIAILVKNPLPSCYFKSS